MKKKKELKVVIHSYSRNKTFEGELCDHFPLVKFSWKTRYAFFTLGWKIEIFNVIVKCKCEELIYFNDQTFSSNNRSYKLEKECCNNYVFYSAKEGEYDYVNDGLVKQKKIEEQIKEMKNLEEKLKKTKEETERMEKEEKNRRKMEEKKKKEREKKRESENKELNKIIEQQEKENEELNQIINTDISWIDTQMNQMTESLDINYSESINFDVKKEINKNLNFQIVKN